MTIDEAKQRIQNAIDQYGAHAAPAIDLVINEVRADLGREAANNIIEDFDLELRYQISPTEFE
jgi:hypothetical protein